MALIVEDGTGLSDAESYNSVTEFRAWATAQGKTLTDSDTDAKIEEASRRAVVWQDTTFRPRFSGYKRNQRDQALECPRIGAYDFSTYGDVVNAYGSNVSIDVTIPETEIPKEIKQAQHEATFRELNTPGYLLPDVVLGTQIKSASVDGAVSVTYHGAGGVKSALPIMTIISRILAPLLAPYNSDGMTGQAYR